MPLRTAARALGLALALGAGTARAQPRRPLDLAWSAPSSCPDRARVLARVAELLHRPGEAPAGAPLAVRAEAAQGPDGRWRLRLETRTPQAAGTRTLDGADCAGVADAAALVIALALDPDAAEGLPPAGTTPRPVSRGGLRVAFGADVVADVGALPAFAPGVGGHVAVLLGARWRIEARGATWAPSPRFAAATGGAGVDVALELAWALRGCGALLVAGRFDLGLCAGPELGLLAGTGRGVEAAVTDRHVGLWWNVGLAAGWAATAWLGLRAWLEVGATLVGPRFALARGDATEDVFRVAPTVVRGALGVELRFP